MAKKHDENKDIRLVGRIAKIDYSSKTIQASKNALIGNTTWGRIDFLTHYCNWSFVWNNEVRINPRHNSSDDNIKTNKREAKKRIKESSLTNKNNKSKKKNNGKSI